MKQTVGKNTKVVRNVLPDLRLQSPIAGRRSTKRYHQTLLHVQQLDFNCEECEDEFNTASGSEIQNLRRLRFQGDPIMSSKSPNEYLHAG